MSGDFLSAGNSFRRGNVCQRLTRCTIADGVVARDICLVVVIYYDFAFVSRDADIFQTDVLNVGDNTYR